MPPFHGGGSMIGRVTFAETTWRRRRAASRPARRRSGQAIGLGAACNVDARARLDEQRTRTRWRWSSGVMDGLQKIDGAQLFGRPALQNRYPVRVVPARRRASARRGADARFVRRRGARRPSLLPAADGPLRPRRHDARLDRALQRQHRHRRAADRRASTRPARCDEPTSSTRTASWHLPRPRPGRASSPQPTKSARRDNPLCGDRVIDRRQARRQRQDRRDRPSGARLPALPGLGLGAGASIAVGRDASRRIDKLRHDAERAIGREERRAEAVRRLRAGAATTSRGTEVRAAAVRGAADAASQGARSLQWPSRSSSPPPPPRLCHSRSSRVRAHRRGRAHALPSVQSSPCWACSRFRCLRSPRTSRSSA